MFSLLRLPALQALLIQLAALVLAVLVAAAFSAASGWQPNLFAAVFLQAAVAAGLARWYGVPPWWVWIHSLFVPALALLLTLQFPSWIYLLLFLAMLALYWQTFRTRVPYYPSTRAVRAAAAGLLPRAPGRCIDIGSGFGGLVLDLAARRPDCTIEGVELAPLPWFCSWLRGRLSGNGARFILGDYADLDFSQYDLVFAYLSPAAMPSLWIKAQAEMRSGALLLSFEFEVPGVEPDVVLCPQDGQAMLYGWRM